MNTYRYALDRSPRKWICPQCGQKTFVRYVDTFSGEYVKDARSGRCDRQIKCRYHLPPREADLSGQGTCIKPVTVRPRRTCTLDIDPQPFYRWRSDGNLYRYLLGRGFARKDMERVWSQYLTGCSRHNGTVFWQRDLRGRIRTGKVIYYNLADGHRVKRFSPVWVHTKVELPPDWTLSQCLFGEHLLASGACSDRVSLVESEKTAMVMSLLQPERTWLACGGRMNFGAYILQALKGVETEVYPDIDAMEDWALKAAELNRRWGFCLRLIHWHRDYANPSPTWDIADAMLEKQGHDASI